MRELFLEPFKNNNCSVAEYGIIKKYTDGDKMDSMDGCSTCCMFNSFCKKMQAMGKDCVCSRCFGKGMSNSFGWMNKDKNGDDKYFLKASKEISKRIYSESEIPFLNVKNRYGVFRIESFGEIINLNHAINLVNLIKKNPDINFGWWTKRPEMIARALKKLNLSAEWLKNRANIIYSNPWINGVKEGKTVDISKILKKYTFLSGVFAVFTANYAIKNNVFINCGYKKCIECLNCYNVHTDIFYINEIMKSQRKKYYKLLNA